MAACANCGVENPGGQKFCGGCGNALAASCTSCGSSNSPGQRFCGECGAALGPGPAAAAPSPRAVAEPVLA